MRIRMKRIDIVVPVFNEADIIDALYSRISAAIQPLRYAFNLIFVDDGSVDHTCRKLEKIQEKDSSVTILKLSRNWGQQSAYNAGIDYADADAVVLMDGDLEDPPEIIPRMINEWEQGNEVVYAVKTRRKDPLLKKVLIRMFYKGMEWFANVSVDNQSGMFSLIDRKALNSLKICKERHKYYVGLRSFVGFKQKRIDYEREKRYANDPRQTFRKLINYALDAFFAFSFFPIRLLTYFGAMVIFCIVIMTFVLSINKLFGLHFILIAALPGWTTLVMLICFILGVQIIFMGILGEYIVRIFDEVRDRPYYVVSEVKKA